MRSRRPLRTGTRRPPLPPPLRCLVLAGLLVALLLVAFCAHRLGAPAATAKPATPAPHSPLTQELGTLPVVRSVAAIRETCAAHAPALSSAPWMTKLAEAASRRGDVVALEEALTLRAANPATAVFYRVAPHPVCVDRSTGLFYVSRDDQELYAPLARGRSPLYPAHAQPTLWEALEAVLPPTDGSSSDAVTWKGPTVRVVPALGVFGFGYFVSTHMWHLLRDSMEALITAFHTYAHGVLWRLPRQAVLLDEMRTRWLDRGGDTPRKMAISAAMLNTLSTLPGDLPPDNSPPAAAAAAAHRAWPLLSSAMIVRVASEDELRDRYTAQQFKARGVAALFFASPVSTFVPDTLECFCQGMMARNAPTPRGAVLKPLDELVQDRVAVVFGAPPYRNATQESVWDIERQRIEQYPAWARQLWPATLPAGGGAPYQPRVLFIHRARRTIANVSVYVRAMRDMGFRVEEAYLERLPTAQQYYLGRYADVVVGMHGLGIGHALWMNRYPTGCRTVIEFRLWAAKGVPVGLQDILMRRMGLYYATPEPIDVVFGRTVVNSAQARHAIKHMRDRGYQHPGWDDQEAVFSQPDVLAMIEEVKAHLLRCLPMQ